MSRSGRRTERLKYLASGYSVTNECPLVPIVIPPIPESTKEDRSRVQQALAQTRQAQPLSWRKLQLKISRSGSNSAEATQTLERLVQVEEPDKRCTPGQAVELLKHGADVNLSAPSSRTAWDKIRNRKAIGSRTTLFQYAVDQQDVALVTVLAKNADSQNLDRALAVTMVSENIAITKILMGRGADPNTCAEHFHNAVKNGDSETVALLCSGSSSLHSDIATRSLYDAVIRSDCVIARILTWVGADTDLQDPSVLSIAVESMNLPLVAILCMAKVHPSPSHLENNIVTVCEGLYASSVSEEVLMLVEMLLAAGAAGQKVSEAMVRATERRQHQLVQLFASYLDIDPEHTPNALKEAISCGDTELLSALLAIGPATETVDDMIAYVRSIRSVISSQKRFEMMKMLVRSRPSISAMSEALRDASQEQELDLARHLVESGAVVTCDESNAMLTAIRLRADGLLSILIRSNPSQAVLSLCLKEVDNIRPSEKVGFIRTLLSISTAGFELDCSLLVAVINHDQSLQSFEIIESLIQNGADVNVQQGQCFLTAIARKDISVIELLLKGLPSQDSIQRAYEAAMLIKEPNLKFNVFQILLMAGAKGPSVDKSLCVVIDGTSEGARLSRLILHKGTPNINTSGGEVLRRMVSIGDLELLYIVMNMSPTVGSLNSALQQAVELKDRKSRLETCRMLLKAGASGSGRDLALTTAVQSFPGDKELVELLLSFNASIDFDSGKVLCTAISAADEELVSILLRHNPRPQTLVNALRHLFDLHSEKSKQFHTATIMLGTKTHFPSDSLGTLLPYSFDESSDLRTLELLLSKGASVNLTPHDAFKKAVDLRNQAALQLLLKAGPGKESIRKVFAHTWETQCESGFDLMRIIIQEDVHRDMIDTDEYLSRAIHRTPPSHLLIEFLLEAKASVGYSNDECLHYAAARLDHRSLALILPSVQSRGIVTAVFAKLMESSSVWDVQDGLRTVKLLLEFGANGEALDHTLLATVEKYGAHNNAPGILDHLIKHQASSDYLNGQALKIAARRGDPSLVTSLFDTHPSQSTITDAFPYIFLSPANIHMTIELMDIFSQHCLSDIDLNKMYTDMNPILFLCMSKWPSSTHVLRTLIERGASPDQTISHVAMKESQPEQVTALLWALLQAQPRIDDSVIIHLIKSNANLNFATSDHRITPLIAAIQQSRTNIVSSLLTHDVDIAQADRCGLSPLCHASVQNDLNIVKMLLDNDAPTEDGSLHCAALSCKRLQASLLLESGHDPNFPSPCHDGHPPLEALVRQQEYHHSMSDLKAMFELLVHRGANPSYQLDGKSLLYIALDMPNASHVVPALLSAFMGKLINSEFNLYHSGNAVYSPIAYVKYFLQGPDITKSSVLLKTLSSYGCTEIYYHKSGAQPEGYIRDTAPEMIRQEEDRRLRRLREEQEAEEDKDNEIRRQREHNQARIDNEAQAHKERMSCVRDAAAEAQRISNLTHNQQLAHLDEEAAMREQHAVNERQNDLAHHRAKAALSHETIRGENELRIEGQKQVAMVEAAATDTRMIAIRRENQLQIDARRIQTAEEQRSINARVAGEQKIQDIAAKGRIGQEAYEKGTHARFLEQAKEKRALANVETGLNTSRQALIQAQSSLQQKQIEYKYVNDGSELD